MVNAASSPAPGVLSRWAARVGLALIALSLAGLVALAVWDRTRHWETPRFDPARFVALEAPAPAQGGEERWCVVVNPDCAHCRSAFPAIAARRDSVRPRPELDLLIVDCDRRPAPAALAPFPADRAWWDSSGVWRDRWGHRVYAEVLRFAPGGALLGVDPPPAVR